MQTYYSTHLEKTEVKSSTFFLYTSLQLLPDFSALLYSKTPTSVTKICSLHLLSPSSLEPMQDIYPSVIDTGSSLLPWLYLTPAPVFTLRTATSDLGKCKITHLLWFNACSGILLRNNPNAPISDLFSHPLLIPTSPTLPINIHKHTPISGP